jgi:hypothetical protein
MPSPNKSKKGGGRSKAPYDGDTSRPTQRAGASEVRVEELEIKVGKLEKEVKRLKRVDLEREARMVALEDMVKVTGEVSKEQKGRAVELEGRMGELEGQIGEEGGDQGKLATEVERLEAVVAAMGKEKGELDREVAEAMKVKGDFEEVLGRMRDEEAKMIKEGNKGLREAEGRIKGEVGRLRESVEALEKWRREGVSVGGNERPREEEKGPLEYVILTDSNGRDMAPELIKAHIPKDQRNGRNIRVETIYTLAMARGKLTGGLLDVDGARVVLDVGTNDVRGTDRMARIEPDAFARRYGEVVRLLKEKGAVEVVACELKCMGFMDVTPYSNAIHSLSLRLDIRGCKTQIGISHLGKDGYHILPSCFTMLAKTYACAIMGVHVPCPPPAWDRYRDPNLRGRWPTPREARDQGNSHGRG